MYRNLVLPAMAVCAVAVAACSSTPTTPTTQLSQMSSRFSLLPIAERVQQEVVGIHCGAPGGGTGSSGEGPHGEPLAHHYASISCEYAGGTIKRLAEAWERAAGPYLESERITVTVPGSFGSEQLRGLDWQYTSGAASGVLTITIVSVGGDSYRVLGNLVEFVPRA